VSDTSLVFNVLARDRASRVFRKLRNEADDTGRILRFALGPALMPILATSTAGVVGLGAALAGVGASAGVFGAVVKSSFTEVNDASSKTKDLRDKIGLLGEQIKVANQTGIGDAGKLTKAQITATNELMARYQQMPPSLRNVTIAYDGLKGSWKGFVDQNKPSTYNLMTGGMSLLATNVQKLQPLYDAGATAARKLLDMLTTWAGKGGIDKMVAFLTSNAEPAFDSLISIAKDVGITLGNIFTTFAPTGQGFLTWLATAAGDMAAWSSGNGLQKFMQYATANGPGVVTTLTNFATSAVIIAKAVGPLAPVSMAIATALSTLVAAIPPGVITALVAAWVAFGLAMKVYAIYGAIAAGVQWAMNAALFASPITWIVLAILILIGIIVLVATKTKFFQTIWAAVWGFLKTVGAWFAGPFAGFFVKAWHTITSAASTAWGWIKTKVSGFVSWITGIPGKVSAKLKSMWDGLKSGFKAAVNWVIGKWNSLHFSIPSFSVFGKTFGGGTIGVPAIPYMATGGTISRSGMAVVGEAGPELLTLDRGAQVAPLTKARRPGGSGGSGVIVLDLRGADGDMKRMIRKWIRTDNLLQGA
jgi:hypothetical protein